MMSKQKIIKPSKEDLLVEYSKPGSTISSLARLFNTSQPTVRSWLISYQIQRKTHLQASQEANQVNQTGKSRLANDVLSKLNDRDWLYEHRITKQMSFESIGELLGISRTPVVEACKKLGIPVVKHNESNSLTLSYLRDKQWLIEQHKTNKKQLHIIADEIHTTQATLSRWLSYHNIQANQSNIYDREYSRTSLEEQQVVDFCRSLGVEVIQGNRSLLNGMEIDIFIPEYNLAIEYNGIYSHLFRPDESNFSRRKDSKYHISKTLNAKKNGISLIHLYSDDWVLRQPICKSIILSKLGMTDRIQARKTLIDKVSVADKNVFLNNNHIQGACGSTINLGLYYQQQLVAIMTFSPSRFNKSYKWELVRYCSILNTTVVGGFSKLLKHFRDNNPGSIISYADFSRSNGDVYHKNGFVAVKHNRPSYSYVNLNKGLQRYHRSNFTKKKLGIGSETTEENFMLDNGWNKIYDCGTIVFVLQ